ncbi:MAG: hypothetical protein R6U50_17990 [Desulfobacterales bacterium]
MKNTALVCTKAVFLVSERENIIQIRIRYAGIDDRSSPAERLLHGR